MDPTLFWNNGSAALIECGSEGDEPGGWDTGDDGGLDLTGDSRKEEWKTDTRDSRKLSLHVRVREARGN